MPLPSINYVGRRLRRGGRKGSLTILMPTQANKTPVYLKTTHFETSLKTHFLFSISEFLSEVSKSVVCSLNRTLDYFCPFASLHNTNFSQWMAPNQNTSRSTLYKTCSSEKPSYPRHDIHFLRQNEIYFRMGYAK